MSQSSTSFFLKYLEMKEIWRAVLITNPHTHSPNRTTHPASRTRLLRVTTRVGLGKRVNLKSENIMKKPDWSKLRIILFRNFIWANSGLLFFSDIHWSGVECGFFFTIHRSEAGLRFLLWFIFPKQRGLRSFIFSHFTGSEWSSEPWNSSYENRLWWNQIFACIRKPAGGQGVLLRWPESPLIKVGGGQVPDLCFWDLSERTGSRIFKLFQISWIWVDFASFIFSI